MLGEREAPMLGDREAPMLGEPAAGFSSFVGGLASC